MAPTRFQLAAVERLREVLRQHGIVNDFQLKPGRPVTAWVSFAWRGDEYDLAVFEANINMREGLFECYLSREWKSDDTLIESFARRVDRYLSGGPWEEPMRTNRGR